MVFEFDFQVEVLCPSLLSAPHLLVSILHCPVQLKLKTLQNNYLKKIGYKNHSLIGLLNYCILFPDSSMHDHMTVTQPVECMTECRQHIFMPNDQE